MKFELVVQEGMSFKDISLLDLWQPLCSADWSQFCNFGRRHHEEQSCEIILNYGSVVQEEMPFKVFLSGALAALLFSGAKPFVQFRLL